MNRKRTILVVEDDYVSYKLISRIIGKLGHKVIWAQNGLEAVEICKNNSAIDLVLMDINMPVMDGLEATCIIKQLRKELPVVIQTAFLDNKEKSLESGCDEFIYKPLEREMVSELINKYTKG